MEIIKLKKLRIDETFCHCMNIHKPVDLKVNETKDDNNSVISIERFMA